MNLLEGCMSGELDGKIGFLAFSSMLLLLGF